MPKSRVNRALSIAAIASAAWAVTGCGKLVADPPSKPSTPSAAEAPRVTAAAPEKMTLRRVTEQPGQVEAYETTPLLARLGGFVKSVTVDIGDRVKAGQVLATLDVPDIEADVEQKRALMEHAEANVTQAEAAVTVAKAAITSAEAKVAEAQATTRRAEADVTRWQAESARIEQLVRESAVTASLGDETRSKLEAASGALDGAKAQALSVEAAVAEAKAMLDKAKADVTAAQAHVKVARAEANGAEAMFSYARVTAPFDGIVTRRHVDTGHLTTAGATGGASEPLFVVARDDMVTVVVAVPESEAALVGPGDPASVRVPALGDKPLTGKVTRTSGVLDPATRTLRAEIDLPGDGQIRPGLYAYVTIISEEKQDALTVPVTALARDAGKTFVVVADAGRARRKEVTAGLSDGTRVEILKGLEPGALVVATGADAITDGQPVQVAPNAQPETPAKK